jgi:hypothetical protein
VNIALITLQKDKERKEDTQKRVSLNVQVRISNFSPFLLVIFFADSELPFTYRQEKPDEKKVDQDKAKKHEEKEDRKAEDKAEDEKSESERSLSRSFSSRVDILSCVYVCVWLVGWLCYCLCKSSCFLSNQVC